MFSHLASGRSSAVLRRSVVGVLATLLLNMAVLPCAMAFQGDDCAHCPPAEQHEEGHTMAAHHEHDKAAAVPSCATAQSDCCDEIAIGADARGSKPLWTPAADVVLQSAPAPADSNSRPPSRWYGWSRPPDPAGSSPPLHVLFCVYLK